MTTNTESNNQVLTIDLSIITEPKKPEKERKQYSHESLKEFLRYKRKLGIEQIQYLKDLEKYNKYKAEEKYKLENNGASMPIIIPEKTVSLTVELYETERNTFVNKVKANKITQSSLIKKWINLYNQNAKVSIKPSKSIAEEKKLIEEKIVNTVQATSHPIPEFLEKALRDEIDSLKKTNSQLKVDKYKSDKVMLKFNSISTVFSFTELETLDYLEKLISSKKSENLIGGK